MDNKLFQLFDTNSQYRDYVNQQSHSGLKPKYYLVFNKEWSIKKLNILQQIIRYLFGAYKETHKRSIHEPFVRDFAQITLDPNSKSHQAIAKISRLFPDAMPMEKKQSSQRQSSKENVTEKSDTSKPEADPYLTGNFVKINGSTRYGEKILKSEITELDFRFNEDEVKNLSEFLSCPNLKKITMPSNEALGLKILTILKENEFTPQISNLSGVLAYKNLPFELIKKQCDFLDDNRQLFEAFAYFLLGFSLLNKNLLVLSDLVIWKCHPYLEDPEMAKKLVNALFLHLPELKKISFTFVDKKPSSKEFEPLLNALSKHSGKVSLQKVASFKKYVESEAGEESLIHLLSKDPYVSIGERLLELMRPYLGCEEICNRLFLTLSEEEKFQCLATLYNSNDRVYLSIGSRESLFKLIDEKILDQLIQKKLEEAIQSKSKQVFVDFCDSYYRYNRFNHLLEAQSKLIKEFIEEVGVDKVVFETLKMIRYDLNQFNNQITEAIYRINNGFKCFSEKRVKDLLDAIWGSLCSTNPDLFLRHTTKLLLDLRKHTTDYEVVPELKKNQGMFLGKHFGEMLLRNQDAVLKLIADKELSQVVIDQIKKGFMKSGSWGGFAFLALLPYPLSLSFMNSYPEVFLEVKFPEQALMLFEAAEKLVNHGPKERIFPELLTFGSTSISDKSLFGAAGNVYASDLLNYIYYIDTYGVDFTKGNLMMFRDVQCVPSLEQIKRILLVKDVDLKMVQSFYKEFKDVGKIRLDIHQMLYPLIIKNWKNFEEIPDDLFKNPFVLGHVMKKIKTPSLDFAYKLIEKFPSKIFENESWAKAYFEACIEKSDTKNFDSKSSTSSVVTLNGLFNASEKMTFPFINKLSQEGRSVKAAYAMMMVCKKLTPSEYASKFSQDEMNGLKALMFKLPRWFQKHLVDKETVTGNPFSYFESIRNRDYDQISLFVYRYPNCLDFVLQEFDEEGKKQFFVSFSSLLIKNTVSKELSLLLKSKMIKNFHHIPKVEVERLKKNDSLENLGCTLEFLQENRLVEAKDFDNFDENTIDEIFIYSPESKQAEFLRKVDSLKMSSLESLMSFWCKMTAEKYMARKKKAKIFLEKSVQEESRLKEFELSGELKDLKKDFLQYSSTRVHYNDVFDVFWELISKKYQKKNTKNQDGYRLADFGCHLLPGPVFNSLENTLREHSKIDKETKAFFLQQIEEARMCRML